MSLQLVPLFPGIPGGPELLVILFIAVLLFGANKIPKLARSSGEAIGEFQKGREEVRPTPICRVSPILRPFSLASRSTASGLTDTARGKSL
ncbi:hypothetical protein BRC93_15680 [Halobacteriales archaeon QS_5_70_15]|nr:MAG: hypothetical protein BRC93_15680 [Halobacteriales archaeon QS_5_70_15]